MITKEMIMSGIRKGVISIEDEFGGCTNLCCKIGDNAFYFAGKEDEYLSAKEFFSLYSFNMIVDMLYDILKDAETAENNGLDIDEYEYYVSLLYMIS